MKDPAIQCSNCFQARLATNFRKQFDSWLTPQFSDQTVCRTTGDEFSRTVRLAKDPAVQCSNCLPDDRRRIFANSLSREGPSYLFAGRLTTNFRKRFVSWRTPQFNAQTVSWATGDEFSQTVCLVKDPVIQCSNCQSVCRPTGDEFSQTVCFVKDPAIQC